MASLLPKLRSGHRTLGRSQLPSVYLPPDLHHLYGQCGNVSESWTAPSSSTYGLDKPNVGTRSCRWEMQFSRSGIGTGLPSRSVLWGRKPRAGPLCGVTELLIATRSH